ncbi:MAG: acyltransferase family protein [Bacteroidia bacterium]
MPSKTSVYFPSLNGVRFIAAGLVFIHHFVIVFFAKNHDDKTRIDVFSPMGGTGVTLFFVLSGYLITYLLLTEFGNEQTINIKDFYIRRVLRIWPLYFFTLGISLLYAYFTYSLSTDFFSTKFLLYVFFLPNIASIIFISGGFPTQLWSVGSEEQFYLFWPWLIMYFRKKLKLILILIPTLFFALRIILFFIIHTQQPIFFKEINMFNFFSEFANNFRVDCMAIGGCFAWLLFNKHKYLQVLYSKKVQLVSLSLIVLLILFGFNMQVINYPIYSLLFGIIILNVSSNKFSMFNLKHNLFEELGKISYGLYVFHPMILILTDKYIERLGFTSPIVVVLLGFVISFSLTVLISYLSFKYLESPFLKLKHKFSKIISGNEALQAN